MKALLSLALLLFAILPKAQQTIELCEDYRNTFTYYSSSNVVGTWLWTVGEDTLSRANTVTITWDTPGSYEIVADFESGCPVNPRKYWVHVIECTESAIYFPNAFTPNGDGTNDRWGPKGVGIVKIKWTIFNRWGVEVYRSESMNDWWDGSFRSGEYYVQNDVYIYKAEWVGINGVTGSTVGHVVLIR
jgi:gliding motility-associated-like protein